MGGAERSKTASGQRTSTRDAESEVPQESFMRLNRSRLCSIITSVILAFFLTDAALAQEGQAPEGKDWGNYHVNQSIEFGWRGKSFTGNNDVYDTFVNLGQGARLYNHTLEMRSLNHQGFLFDNLYMSSFGYGGDPNDFSMLRLSKDKWYNFSGTFRRDRNLWNYDLLANPLNPTSSTPTVIIGFSPHSMALTRRMSDFNLTLLPESRVRFRLGYSRNINEGPSLTTYHVGTEALLFQNWKTTTNAYQVGVDFKVLPRTNFSYDQFLNYYKGDTSWGDNNLLFQLSTGQPVDLGISWDTRNNVPCAAPLANPTTTPPTATPTCPGYTGYARSGPVRTSYPTEQFSFQSSYFHNVDMAGRFVYSSSDARVNNFSELFQGFESRTRARQLTTAGPAGIIRKSVSADYAVTFAITPKFRVVDEFRFIYFRIPGQNNLSTSALFGTSMATAPVVFNAANCPAPYTDPRCPPHNTSSEADAGIAISSLFLGQDAKLNTLQFEYDFTKRIGGRLGYRYRHRVIDERNVATTTNTYDPTIQDNAGVRSWPDNGPCRGLPLNPDGSCTVSGFSTQALANVTFSTTINEHSLLAGVWVRPTDTLRLSYDQELLYADDTFTRISPRQLQHYKLRATYKPIPWMSFASTVNVYEARNNVAQINHLEHTRNYGFNLSVAPGDWWSIDLGYNYTGVLSQTNICFIFGAGPPPPGFPPCPIAGSPGPLQGISVYNNKLNYGYGDLTIKPVKRVTLAMGYSIDSVTGNTLILSPNSPAGPLNSNFHRPHASVAIDLAKGWSWKTAWGFYDYNEKGAAIDPIGRRSFRGNLVNLSAVYSF